MVCGAGPAMTVGDGLFGVFGAIVVGGLLAVAAAVGLSPLVLLGPVRNVEHFGLAFDWTVLGIGLAAIIAVMSAVAVAVGLRQAPHRQTCR